MKAKKILIVDYDQKSLDSLAGLFSPYDLEIIRAADGKSAYELYRSEDPDLILMEAMLPKLHGFDLAKKIYEETKGTVPIIVVTGLYKGTKYKNEALRTFGVAEYFEKPYDGEKLVGAVMNLLHEEIDLERDLPSVEKVVALLSEMMDESQAGEGKKQS